jgi:hypothetical protein
MGIKYSNNAKTTLSSGINDSVTSAAVASGAVFPALSGGDYFYATIETINYATKEIVKVTARSGNTLTIVRAQDNTSAAAFSSGDFIELRVTAAVLEDATEPTTGITAGTVIASKAIITDSNKDITGGRNITISGELDAGSLDVLGDADIDGTLEADAMTLNGTAITATATLSTGISNTNVPVFTSGVADDDFLRVAGTSIEGRSAAEVLSDIGASAVAGSGSIVTTGALNSGSITSGFGTINNGASAITTTGAITGGSVLVADAGTIGSASDADAVAISSAGQVSLSATNAIKLNVGTTAQRPTGAAGLMRYNSTLGQFEGYGAAWGALGGGATGGGSDSVFVENSDDVTTSYTITSGKNAMSVGPITVEAGVVVTIPTGSRWVIL